MVPHSLHEPQSRKGRPGFWRLPCVPSFSGLSGFRCRSSCCWRFVRIICDGGGQEEEMRGPLSVRLSHATSWGALALPLIVGVSGRGSAAELGSPCRSDAGAMIGRRYLSQTNGSTRAMALVSSFLSPEPPQAASLSSSRSQISTRALVSSRIISSVCAGPGVKRSLSVPRGTVGKLMGCT